MNAFLATLLLATLTLGISCTRSESASDGQGDSPSTVVLPEGFKQPESATQSGGTVGVPIAASQQIAGATTDAAAKPKIKAGFVSWDEPDVHTAGSGLFLAPVANGNGGSKPDKSSESPKGPKEAGAKSNADYTVLGLKIKVLSMSAYHADLGWQEIGDFGSGIAVDLLDSESGVLSDLPIASLEPGLYEQVRLHIAPESVLNVIEGNEESKSVTIKIPSGEQSGIKLKSDVSGAHT